MKQKQMRYLGSAGLTAVCLISGVSQAQSTEAPEATAARLEALKQQITEQTKRLEALKRSLTEQEATLNDMKRAIGRETLAVQRGGSAKAGAPAQVAQATQQEQTPVGQAPERESRPPEVAPIFDQPGVLTPKNKFVFDPSFQYSYSSSNRVALVGYTIIPAILIGVIDVREVKRTTAVGAISGRYGITNRLEVEAKVPYVYRSDTAVGREFLTGTGTTTVFNASGKGIGDVELTARYQFNNGGIDKPYYVGSLRYKSRTGTDPFEVDTSTTVLGFRSDPLQTELPTGSGFHGLQPALTVLYPSDPAVFFGTVSYLHNFKRSHITRKVDGGDQDIGSVEPGGIFGFNFGMGLALNEKSSFSIGYDHSSVGKTKVNGQVAADSVRVQLGTLLLGYSHRLSDKRTLSVSVGAGLTRDTPDVSLSVRMPTSF